jgi:hypothetical protein
MLHWLQKLHLSTLKLLLPLLVFLIGFGMTGEFLTNQLLSRSYNTVDKLLADKQTVKTQLAVNVLVTAVEVEKEQNYTTVEFKTGKSVLKKIQFEIPVTELNAVKEIIATEMGQKESAEILQTGKETTGYFSKN